MSILSGDEYNDRKIQNKKKIGKRIRKKLGVTLLIHLLPFHLDNLFEIVPNAIIY
jgi:hypothetical protein